jgi:hypothetical protein
MFLKKLTLSGKYEISWQLLRLGSVNEAGGFRDSEYKILLKVAKPAFALFFFWLLFSFQRNILLRKSGTLVLGKQKKKSDSTTI